MTCCPIYVKLHNSASVKNWPPLYEVGLVEFTGWFLPLHIGVALVPGQPVPIKRPGGLAGSRGLSTNRKKLE